MKTDSRPTKPDIPSKTHKSVFPFSDASFDVAKNRSQNGSPEEISLSRTDRIKELMNEFVQETSLPIQSEILAAIVTLDSDPNIGKRTCYDNLMKELHARSIGIEFLRGDAVIAAALLTLIHSNKSVEKKVQKLCELHQKTECQTPFDYREAIKDSETRNSPNLQGIVSKIFDLFTKKSLPQLASIFQIGQSPMSTKPMRFGFRHYEAIESILQNSNIKVDELLDIGGATGESTLYFMKRFNIPKACIMDIRSRQLLGRSSYGKIQEYPNIQYYLGRKADITKYTIPHKHFSCILLSNIIMHIKDKKTALFNTLKMLSYNGLIVLYNNSFTYSSEYGMFIILKRGEKMSIYPVQKYAKRIL